MAEKEVEYMGEMYGVKPFDMAMAELEDCDDIGDELAVIQVEAPVMYHFTSGPFFQDSFKTAGIGGGYIVVPARFG